MRSIGLLAVVSGTLVLGSSCSEGRDLARPENEAPVANFDLPACTIDEPCEFVSTSTDDAAVTGWSWDYDGDNTPDATTATAEYTYRTAGDFDVSLTVFDAEGLSHRKTSRITIDPAGTPPPTNTPPTAGFTYSCDGLDCTFANTSSDAAPGTIATYAWTFGDNATSDQASPTHTYTVTARDGVHGDAYRDRQRGRYRRRNSNHLRHPRRSSESADRRVHPDVYAAGLQVHQHQH